VGVGVAHQVKVGPATKRTGRERAR
jgi:hypothetical protein